MTFLKEQVSTGRFNSEAEVVIESVAAFQDHFFDEEAFLHDVVAPGYDRMRANPSSGYTVEQVEAHLKARREKRDQL